jgi:hypothetical protein
VKRLWAPGLVRYLTRRPAKAWILARAGWRLRRDGWPYHPPFLPLPDSSYWHFRMVTVNGSSGARLSPASMVEAAEWALAQPIGRSA